MKKNFYSRQNSFFSNRQRKKIFRRAIWSLLILFLIIILVRSLGGKISYLFKQDNYYSQISAQVNAKLDLEILFNDETRTDVFSQRIIEAIDNAEQSIEIAMFALTSPNIVAALKRADTRGVEIKLVLDESNHSRHHAVLNKFFLAGQAISSGVDDEAHNVGYFMHHKFMLVDQGLEQAQLITGSLNWTDWQEQYDPSYLIITRRPELLNIYKQEFDRLWNGVAGTAKLRQSDYQPWIGEFNYSDSKLELWWSPGFKENSFRQRLLDLIASAENNIKIAIWQLTDYNITQALLARAVQGVDVFIITDDYNIWSKDSEFLYLFKQKKALELDNLEIVSDSWRSVDLNNVYQIDSGEFFNSYFHRHGLLIDDKTLSLGTANWSYRGFWQNDENALITDDFNLVQAWQDSWNYHYQSLRQQLVGLTNKDNGFKVDSWLDSFVDQNLLAICEVSSEVREPEVLLKTKINSPDQVFIINAKCPQPITIFIYDNKNNLLASDWFY